MAINKVSPIGILTYTRLNHLRRTVDALRDNVLASETEVFFFSDAPQQGDEEKVYAVRTYIETIEGFRNVVLVKRKKNGRKENSTAAQRFLLETYGKMIFMEDDTVPGRYFLKFMNDMLDAYENDMRILLVCGYSPPIDYPSEYRHGYFLSRRMAPWGFATWRDRGTIDAITNYDVYLRFLDDLSLFFRAYGVSRKTVVHSLRSVFLNRELRGDAMMFAMQVMNRQYCIIPMKSMISNIGLDGSGLHCGHLPRYATANNKYQTAVEVVDNLQYDIEVDEAFMNFFNDSPRGWQRLSSAKALARFFLSYVAHKVRKAKCCDVFD